MLLLPVDLFLLLSLFFPFYYQSMERNHSVKNFDQIGGTSDDQISGLGQAKSYACIFCKRGFSNAQALGGHMNIHRRDRARIRQYYYSEDQNQLSSDEAKGSSSTVIHHDPLRGRNSEEKTNLSKLIEKEGTNMTPRKPSHPFAAASRDQKVLDRSEGKMSRLEDTEEQLQQPFLLEEPVPASKTLAGCTNIVGGVTVLDLELRLGPEPLETNLSEQVVPYTHVHLDNVKGEEQG